MTRSERLSRWDSIPKPMVTPSLLNCNFSRVEDELDALARAGVEVVHLDVMDGHFVPNLSFGAPLIARWREVTNLTFDAHLMISEPHRYLADFLHAGVDQVVFHAEVVKDPVELIRSIHAAGCRASVALNPPTPVEWILPYLAELDSVLIMSVMPGFGGQSFDATVLDKVRMLRAMRPELLIGIDGGIKPGTAALAVAAGVTQLVAGTAVFRSDGNYAAALAELAEGVRRGLSGGGSPVYPDGTSSPA